MGGRYNLVDCTWSVHSSMLFLNDLRGLRLRLLLSTAHVGSFSAAYHISRHGRTILPSVITETRGSTYE